MNFGVVRIPRNINKALIYIMLTYVILEEFLISVCSFPSALRYCNDIVVLFLLACCLRGAATRFRQARSGGVLAMILLYSACICGGLFLNEVPAQLVLWAARNTYRFFAMYVVCVCFLEREDLLRILEWLCTIQWLNFCACIVEYFGFQKSQDYLGGVFGVSRGCNAYMNVYLCIVTAYIVCQYVNGKKKLSKLVLSLVSSMIISGLAELKIFFIELVVIILLVALLNRSWKKLLPVLLVGGVALLVGLIILDRLFPEHFQIMTSLSQLIAYGNSQSGGYNLSRFHAFANINELFFQDDPLLLAFGYGFGACEYSAYDFLTSPFYQSYGIYNYRWFAHQMIFLETGYAGIVSYISIFAAIGYTAWRGAKKYLRDGYEAAFTIVMCVITVLCIWYNASSRSDCAYLTFFALSAAVVATKDTAPGLLPKAVRDGVVISWSR